MALYIKNEYTNQVLKQVTTIYKGSRHIVAIYEGTKLVWQYIRSCYARAYWINDKPWSNDDGWAN